ncbi:PREDICTED: olfactory receptor 5V1-like [Nanorana parkeri]|uniref:olfactory receptor 5V1-like n=1 Tax=Nanorana parkeri TaxID=125878 RepID=UPI000854C97B|nr:PREDICTED: olfactory receptor 5V1-like [Nanorana parkeri]
MVTLFYIKGITDVSELQVFIFVPVMLIYLITLGGNMTIILLICLDRHLHTPMYFFLANLSIVDVSSSTITLHKVLVIFITGDHMVSYPACITQMYIFASLIGHELLILSAMSYDRYVAVCNPLRYHMIMNSRVCSLLAVSCYLMGFVQVLPAVVIFSGFSCYTSNEINHFFCDMIPLIKIICNDTSVLDIVFLIQGIFVITLLPFLFTFISYIFIICAIMRIRSNTGKRKAFFTCSSHLTVVILLYTTLVSQYLTPTSLGTLNAKKMFSLFNTAAVPMLNPLIYSLKNKDVKSAVKRRLESCKIIGQR